MAAGGPTVEHECPQCGGGVTLGEADRLLECPFCRARLALWPGSFFRYWIPPGAGAGDDVLLAPYWRLRGLDCALRPFRVRERVLDATFPALEGTCLPPTLGVRPQALRMRFATGRTPAFFLAPDRALREALAGTEALSRLADEIIMGEPVLHREFVLESASLVYAPLVVRGDRVLDALLMREVPGCAGRAGEILERIERARRPPLRFFAALCPECGHDLEGRSRSVVLLCRVCRSGWEGSRGGLRRVPCDVHPGPGGAVLLPFWTLRARVGAFGLDTADDLIRFANLTPGVRRGEGAAPLRFWVPAHPLHPAVYLRLARQLTVAQLPPPGPAPAGAGIRGTLTPATIESRHALGAVKVLLALLGQPRREVFPAAPRARVAVDETRLALVPFVPSGADWVQPETGAALQRATLRRAHGGREPHG